jgi:hypothetical protein
MQAIESFLLSLRPLTLRAARFPHETHESFAARMLRARKYVVPDAVALAESIARWRQETNVAEKGRAHTESILGMPKDILVAFYPHAYLNVRDAQGRPVYFERTGSIDVDALLASTTLDKIVDWHLHTLEAISVPLMARATRERTDGAIVDSITNVIDCQGISMTMLNASTRSYLKALTDLDKVYYPELLGKMLIINAPSIFSAIWAIVSPFLDSRTRDKITIVGTDYYDHLVQLLGSSERVPVEYGGRLAVEGGLYKTNAQSITIPAGQQSTLETHVDANRTFSFQYLCRPADIDISISFVRDIDHEPSLVWQTNEAPSDTLKHYSRTEPVEGTYVVTLDNRRGWKQRMMTVCLETTLTHEERLAAHNDFLQSLSLDPLVSE